MTTTHSIYVWGDLACFSRPDGGKVERFSYPVITPSAARSIFEAIYWKPRFRWQLKQIEILNTPQYIALRRNEVKNKAPGERTIGQWITRDAQPEPLWADGDKSSLGTDAGGRTQRQTMALRNVAYRLHAEIRPWPDHRHEAHSLNAQFQRRAARGQCIYQPYFGCREFPAYFQLLEGSPANPPAALDLDIGWMLYDVFNLSRPGASNDSPFISLFQPRVKSGVIIVPEFDSPEVRKPEPST